MGILLYEDEFVEGLILHLNGPCGRPHNQCLGIIRFILLAPEFPQDTSRTRKSIDVDQPKFLILESRRISIQIVFQNLELLLGPRPSKFSGSALCSRCHYSQVLIVARSPVSSRPHAGI